jgi:hypothetical protein
LKSFLIFWLPGAKKNGCPWFSLPGSKRLVGKVTRTKVDKVLLPIKEKMRKEEKNERKMSVSRRRREEEEEEEKIEILLEAPISSQLLSSFIEFNAVQERNYKLACWYVTFWLFCCCGRRKEKRRKRNEEKNVSERITSSVADDRNEEDEGEDDEGLHRLLLLLCCCWW